MNLVADIQIKCNLCPEVYNGQLGFGENHAATRGSGTSTTQGNITSATDILSPYCPSSNKWNRRRVYLMESFVPRFQFTRRIADSATDASRWSFS
jgi:hypothetical protein